MHTEPLGGAPVTTLVLLPGLDGTEVFFRPLLAHLPQSIQTRVLSYPDRGPYGYPELLALVRESLSGVAACTVLASSFGGPLGIMLAAAEPHKVRGLILSATFLRTPRPYLAPFRPALRAPVLWSLRVARRLPVWLRSSDDELRLAKRETWQRVSARGLAARARAALKVDVRTVLADCTQEILSVTYDRDTVVPRHNAEEIRQHCPRARQLMLPGDHLAMFTDPAPLAGAIAAFIGDTGPAPGAFELRPPWRSASVV